MPIEVVAYPSPPNPPGVKVLLGPPIRVTVPPGTPPGTQVSVQVSDSSVPPQSVPVTNTVA